MRTHGVRSHSETTVLQLRAYVNSLSSHDQRLTSISGTQNSTNVYAKNITCTGGTGIAFGSLGQYYNLVSLHQGRRGRGPADMTFIV